MNKDFKFSQHRFNCLATEAQAVLSETGLTPRQLAEQRTELLEALKLAREELGQLPHSLGYGFTHLPKIDAIIAKVTGE